MKSRLVAKVNPGREQVLPRLAAADSGGAAEGSREAWAHSSGLRRHYGTGSSCTSDGNRLVATYAGMCWIFGLGCYAWVFCVRCAAFCAGSSLPAPSAHNASRKNAFGTPFSSAVPALFGAHALARAPSNGPPWAAIFRLPGSSRAMQVCVSSSYRRPSGVLGVRLVLRVVMVPSLS